VFTETMRTEAQFHSMVFPRMLALAERAWHKATWEETMNENERDFQIKTDWEEFADTLGYKELPRLEQKEVFYLVEPPGARYKRECLHIFTLIDTN